MSHLSERVMCDLLRAADSASVDELPSVIRDVLSAAGVRDAVLYLGDYQGTYLRPAPGSTSSDGHASAQELNGDAGRCFREGRVVDGGDGRIWAPVLERADPIGVLELSFGGLDRVDDHMRLAGDAGILTGHLLVTARRYTDVYELASRRREMNLAAEMHWDILPATSYVGPAVALAADLEPAYEIGGDAFDYCLNERNLDFTILDAMGHGLEAALLSVQAMGAYRYARRRRRSLHEIASIVDDALLNQFDGERFVTGLFCRLDLSSGVLRWLNAGHVPPLMVRDGAVEELRDAAPACPVGLGLPCAAEIAETTLEEGDQVVLYSDGVVEARTPEGEYLELERIVQLIENHTARVEVHELVHRLLDEVVKHTAGPLRDDATVLLIEYLGPA